MQNFVVPIIPTSTVDSSSTVPIGSIIAYLPGYFTATSNAGYTGVSQTLSDNWKICDGSVITDVSSPFYSSSPTHYVPNLTNARFLMGSTVPVLDDVLYGGTILLTLVAANIPQHTHTLSGHTHTWSDVTSGASNQSLNHYHYYYGYLLTLSGGGNTLGVNTSTTYSNPFNTDNSASLIHGHPASGTNSICTDASGISPSTAAEAFVLWPQFLTATYIMRIK
jgi:hypothetical protein